MMNHLVKTMAYYCRLSSLPVALTGVSIAGVHYFETPNPAIVCVIAVIYSVYLRGLVCGTLSGFMVIAYCAYFFSIDGSFVHYTVGNLYKISTVIFSISLTIAMVGMLKKQVADRTLELEKINEKLLQLSTQDGLTGIFNRRTFEEILEREWRIQSEEQAMVAIAMIDIDFFKKYNDTYGHQAGDLCLKKVAETIAAGVRAMGACVARYGGEEFVVIFTKHSAAEVVQSCEEIIAAVQSLRIIHEASGVAEMLTVSIGVAAEAAKAGDNPYELLKKADVALYYAKQCGRGCIQLFDERGHYSCLKVGVLAKDSNNS